MKISDLIAQTIIEMLDGEGMAEIQRNDLASKIGCVPSQINYVLTSRFRPEQGFLVESRRGGGGFIRIQRVQLTNADRPAALMHVVNSIGSALDEQSAEIILQNLVYQELIEHEQAQLIGQAASNGSLRLADPKARDYIRADLFKNMLLVLANR